jgi:hypothetical protein
MDQDWFRPGQNPDQMPLPGFCECASLLNNGNYKGYICPGRKCMRLNWVSNTALILGVVMLAIYALVQFEGFGADPLLPATAAFFIGCTAVLDRVGSRELG